MVNGNILLDEDGLNILKIKDGEQRSAVGNFCEMVDEANRQGDVLHYVYDSPCNIYSICYDPTDPHCQLIGQRILSQLQNVFGNFPHPLKDSIEFDSKNAPKTHGGYRYEGCPSLDYVYDKNTIDDWHTEWFKSHPEKIDWSNSPNKVLPEYKRTIDILRESLYEVQNRPETIKGLTHPELLELKSLKIYELSPESVISLFYKLIMNHKNATEEKIAYTKEIGKKICAVNYYKQEDELKRLETDHGNKRVEMVFSIKLDGKYQFLSVDKRHGTFELCNDDGTHLGEVTFDGSFSKQPDDLHSLQRVAEWKKNFNK